MVKETFFIFLKTQSFTPLQLGQQNAKYYIFKFKLENHGEPKEREKELKSDSVRMVARNSVLYFFDLRLINCKECS